jgi:hypothetical protein
MDLHGGKPKLHSLLERDSQGMRQIDEVNSALYISDLGGESQHTGSRLKLQSRLSTHSKGIVPPAEDGGSQAGPRISS